MNRIERLLRPILSSLLISMLIGAQTISLAHASEHDAGLSQDSCATCVGSGQLSAAAVDSGPIHAERFFGPVLCSHQHTVPKTTSTEIPRQRGPPNQL
jgi:hypothetical protein